MSFKTKKSTIIGWQSILVQLAVFLVLFKWRLSHNETAPDEMAPLNLFLHGAAGTNKTKGALLLPAWLGYETGLVDVTTLEHIGDLAGVLNLHTLRESGLAEFTGGLLLRKPILVLDEIVHCPEHVVAQAKLLLQRKLVLLGKQIEIEVQAFIGTGNLASDMLQSQPTRFDTATADRFALIVKVPSQWEMPPDDQRLITLNLPSNKFELDLKAAMKGIEQHFSNVVSESGVKALSYVHTLGDQLKDTPFSFEGRRAQLLYQFVLMGMALCRAQPERELKETLWSITRDCLSYHLLSGIDLDFGRLRSVHEIAYQGMGDTTLEGLIAAATDLDTKMELIVRHLQDVSLLTKSNVFGQVLTSSNIARRLALRKLVEGPLFTDENPELKEIAKRLEIPNEGVSPGVEQWAFVAAMTDFEKVAFEMVLGDLKKMEELLRETDRYLKKWGVTTDSTPSFAADKKGTPADLANNPDQFIPLQARSSGRNGALVV